MCPRPAPSPRRARWRAPLLALSMLAAVGSVAAAGVFVERGESARARADMVREQQVLAGVFASSLRTELLQHPLPAEATRLADVEVEGDRWKFTFATSGGPPEVVTLRPRAYLHGYDHLEGQDHRLLLWSSRVPELRTPEGQRVDLPDVAEHARTGDTWARLTAEGAVLLGLPAEIGVAGLARVDCGLFGRWSVIALSSADRQRDREDRRAVRMVLGVGLVSLIILGFGVALLRTQRHERELAGELELEAQRVRRDAQLAREGRAATVLTFAAGMAHELSTPLGVIAMRAEQLESAAEDERTRRASRVIGDQVTRIRDLAQRFLSVARGGAPSRDRFPASDVLAAARERVQHRFDRAGVALRTRVDASLPWIRGDARLLEHTLTNLLVNACDASPESSAVDLTAAAESRWLTITVRDRGAGIDPALQTRLGEPFIGAKPEGTGLGLAIALEVMRMHRGELRLQKHPQGGTCAVLRLPCEPADVDDDPSGQDPDARPAG
jgi:two-component system NtrC family sensor kinase